MQGARSRKKWNRVRPTWTRLVGLTEASVNILVLAIGFGAAALVSRTVGQSDSGPGRWQIAGVVGRVRGLGDFRAIYQYAVKDANALVSQFTDDDFGSGSGVNVAGHAVRLDAGSHASSRFRTSSSSRTKDFRATPRAPSSFPCPKAPNMTFRYQGQVLFDGDFVQAAVNGPRSGRPTAGSLDDPMAARVRVGRSASQPRSAPRRGSRRRNRASPRRS